MNGVKNQLSFYTGLAFKSNARILKVKAKAVGIFKASNLISWLCKSSKRNASNIILHKAKHSSMVATSENLGNLFGLHEAIQDVSKQITVQLSPPSQCTDGVGAVVGAFVGAAVGGVALPPALELLVDLEELGRTGALAVGAVLGARVVGALVGAFVGACVGAGASVGLHVALLLEMQDDDLGMRNRWGRAL